ncbi:alpha/beta fold hydrolase [Nocardioides sp.]|uniref:alpha/beta fold hydrolase n=1 Tax=Nocardioides sp. TaxID=35761 RepID=UPI003D120759
MTAEPVATPAPRVHEVALSGGGSLFVRDWGPLDGLPVIHHHGMPSSSLAVPGGWDAPQEAGVRVITFDRPGYGRSGARRDRRVSDAAEWTSRIADALAITELSLSGTAAGAPFALAAAAAMGPRVHKLAVLNGLGPDELPGFDPASGMLPETRHEIACARAGESDLRHFISPLITQIDPMEPWLRHLPRSDVEILGRREVQVEDAATYAESMGAGTDGWVDDDLALFHHPWGVDLAEVTARTLLLHGLDDVLVPSAHGDAWALALGHGQLVKLADAGHWLRDYETDVLRWLAAPDDGPASISH